MYEITVKARIQVSATITGEQRCKKGSLSIPHNPSGAKKAGLYPAAVFNATFKALQTNVVTQVAAPSTLSHMFSKSLQA